MRTSSESSLSRTSTGSGTDQEPTYRTGRLILAMTSGAQGGSAAGCDHSRSFGAGAPRPDTIRMYATSASGCPHARTQGFHGRLFHEDDLSETMYGLLFVENLNFVQPDMSVIQESPGSLKRRTASMPVRLLLVCVTHPEHQSIIKWLSHYL